MPKVPPKIIDTAFKQLSKAYGHYPPDPDLAQEIGVHKRTIVNYRSNGYLPPRPKQ